MPYVFWLLLTSRFSGDPTFRTRRLVLADWLGAESAPGPFDLTNRAMPTDVPHPLRSSSRPGGWPPARPTPSLHPPFLHTPADAHALGPVCIRGGLEHR
jgi:hypothetical protein